MPSSHWRIGFAIGLIVGGVLVFLLDLAASEAPNGNSTFVQNVGPAGEYGDQHGNEDTKGDNALSYWVRRFVSYEDTAAQWIMMAFSIVAAVLLWQTLVATQAMATESRNIGRRQVRAYLSIENVAIGVRADRISASWGIRNKGQSQARNTRIVSGWAAEIGDFDPIWSSSMEEMFVGAIPPDGLILKGISTDTDSEPDRHLSPGQIDEVKSAIRGFWIFGIIKYDDAFGDPAETTFRYKLSLRDGKWMMDVCEAGNDMT